MRCVFPIESRDKCPSSSLQHGEARERNAVAVAHREGPPGHRCHGAARTSPTFATVAIQQSAGAAGAFECAGRAGRLPVLAIPGARQPRGQRCIAATAAPPPHGCRQQCRRQPPPPAAAASCRQHCSDSSLCCPGAAAATSVTATSAAAVSVAMAAAAARRASEELHMSVCLEAVALPF